MTKRKKEYNPINTANLFNECSSTLITFLQKLPSSFNKSLHAAMIGAVVTSVLKNSFQLQLALNILVHDKKLIKHLNEYGITSIFQEIKRYKISAAVKSDEKGEELQSSDGLIQVVSDNFDAHIHSQNELKETHSLATMITQSQSKPSLSRNPIPRLTQEKLKSIKL